MDRNPPPVVLSAPDLSHELLNDLQLVIGECDLLHEEFLDYKLSKRLHLIRETAIRMSQRIAENDSGPSRRLH